MKLMQLNAWQGRLTDPLLNFIKEEDPDILFTQEIFSYPTAVSPISPWKQFRLFEKIAEQNHFEHVFFSLSDTFPMLGHDLSYGNAIFSKYKFSHTSTHYTGGPGPLHLDDPADYEGNRTRNFQHAVVNTGKTSLNLINHHGHWVRNPQGDEVSTERLLKMAEYIKHLDGPVIAGGDFNLAPDSSTIRAFQETVKLRDLVAETNAKTTLSEAHYVQNIVCDYILTSPELGVQRIEVSDKLVSDHKAVIAEIDYN